MKELGYDLYWHLAPIFEENNLFGNPENPWAPRNVWSIMGLGLPSEQKIEVKNLRPVSDENDWWALAQAESLTP